MSKAEEKRLDPKSIFLKARPKNTTYIGLMNLFLSYGNVKDYHTYSMKGKFFVLCRYEKILQAENALIDLRQKPFCMEVGKAYKKKIENFENWEENSDSSMSKADNSAEHKKCSINSGMQKFISELIETPKSERFLPLPYIDFRHFDHPTYDLRNIEFETEKCHTCENYKYKAIFNTSNDEMSESKHEKECTNNESNIGKNDKIVSSNIRTSMKNVTNRSYESESTIAFKSAFKQLIPEMEVKLMYITKSIDDSYMCTPLSPNIGHHYEALLENFADVCNNIEGNKRNADGEVLAACIKENDSENWYRTLQLSDDSFALIDTGTTIERSQIIRMIQCPPQFCDLPVFGTVLKTTDILPEGEIIDGKVYEVYDDRCVLIKNDEKEPFGELHDWPVLFSPRLSQSRKSEKRENPKPEKKSLPSQIRFPALRKKQIKTKNKFSIENGSSVVIVHYKNASEVYIRKGQESDSRQYKAIINNAQLSSYNSPPITVPPENSTKILAYYKKIYRRGEVKSYDPVDKLYTVYLNDFGIEVEIPIDNMKEMDSAIADYPEQLICVALLHHKSIVTEEPLRNIISVVTPYIEEETVFNYMYEGEDGWSPKNVELVTKHSNENLSNIICEIAKPVFQQLQEKNINAYDLPVVYYDEMKYVHLNTDASPDSPISIRLLNTIEFADKLFIACTPKHNHTTAKMKTLSKRINDYCLEQTDHYIPRVYEMCLAYYENDETWHRAVSLRNIDRSKNIKLYFIDIAVYSTIDMMYIKKIIPEFVEALPVYALRCYIEDFPVEPSPAMIKEKLDFLNNKTFIQVSSIKIKVEGVGTYKIAF